MHSHRLSSSSLSVSPPPSPQPPASSASKNSRSEQIIQSFYGKVAQVILQSRVFRPQSKNKSVPLIQQQKIATKKQNRWFNIETEEIEDYRNETRYFRNASISEDPPPPMIIEVYLDTSDLTPNQILILVDELKNKHKIDISRGDRGLFYKGVSPSGTKKSILLESWTLSLSKEKKDIKIELPILYKYGITFFRSLYLYVRLLPTYALFQRLKKTKAAGLRIGYRLSVAPSTFDSEIGNFDQDQMLHSGSHHFDSLPVPSGELKLSVVSRLNCGFHLEDGEKLLSSRFQDLDAKMDSEQAIGPSRTTKVSFHRRISSHGDFPARVLDQENPSNTNELPLVKSPSAMGDSQTSSTSIESGSISRSSQLDASASSTTSKSAFKDPTSRQRFSPRSYDSRSFPRTGSDKSVTTYQSIKSSPPSHVDSIRKIPSISGFSPFKSPSLSSSPSLNPSPPSRNSSFGNRSSMSLEKGIFTNSNRVTPPLAIRPSSPAPSKLSSSFGHRFGSISENPPGFDGSSASPSSLTRRTLSVKSSLLFERSQASLHHPGTSMSSLEMHGLSDDLSDFIKALSNPPELKSTGSQPNLSISILKNSLDQYRKTSSLIFSLTSEIEACHARSKLSDRLLTQAPQGSPLRQTGFNMEASIPPSQPVTIPEMGKRAMVKDKAETPNSFSGSVNPQEQTKEQEPISNSFPESKSHRTSLLSQKLLVQNSEASIPGQGDENETHLGLLASDY